MTTILVTKDKLDLIFQFMLLSFWKQTDTTIIKKNCLWLGHNDEPWSRQMFPGNENANYTFVVLAISSRYNLGFFIFWSSMSPFSLSW